MLEDMGCVTPGKALGELKVLFLGRECFESLPEAEILEIYDLHQRELIARSKKNFQELLLERSDLFYQYRDETLIYFLISYLAICIRILLIIFKYRYISQNFHQVNLKRIGFIPIDLVPRAR